MALIIFKTVFYLMCHMTVFFPASGSSPIINGRKVKALSQVPVWQLEKLADSVCNDLEFYIEKLSIMSCMNNFWSNSHKMASDPSTIQIRCQSANSVTLELTPSKHWQLVLLVAEKYETHEYMTYSLLEPETKYTQLPTFEDNNYTIWSAVVSNEGVPIKWVKNIKVPPYIPLRQDHIKYNVNATFVGNYSDSKARVVNGSFFWNSIGENDLCFDVVNICDKAEIQNIYVWPTAQPSVTINELYLDDKCKLRIVGLHGTTVFHYKTPSCADHKQCVLGNTEPESPSLVFLQATDGSDGAWNVNVSWIKPKLLPQRYNIIVNTSAIVRSVEARGNASEAVISNVMGEGIYSVSIYTIIGNLSAHTSRRGLFPAGAAWRWAGAAAGAWYALAAAATLATLAAASLRRRRHLATEHYFLKVEDISFKKDEADVIDIEPGGLEDHWEVRSDRVLLHEVIGEGAFGVVRRGTLAPNGKEVAVKMLKDYPSQDEIRSFRAEMELMKSVGAHPHVVSLVGCCTARRPLIVAEYCSRGDLLSYLRCSWDVMVSKRNAKYYNNNTDSKDYRNDLFKWKLQKESKLVINKLYDLQGICDLELTPLDLLSFCRQIAMGMEFLSSNRVVHRDLAARNILVTGDRTLKIADFGLSRDIYEENQYKQKGNGKMPVKWMALESLTRRIYTTQSDVWSFGVVIWEIVTVGGSPYPDVPAARLVRLLRAGYRMPKPINCSKQLYELMRWCWRAHPRERPTFCELHARLDELLHASAAHHYITIQLDEDDLAPDTAHQPAEPTPAHNYIKMLIRGKNPWSRGESYERPLNTTCNHYTSLPVTSSKTQS